MKSSIDAPVLQVIPRATSEHIEICTQDVAKTKRKRVHTMKESKIIKSEVKTKRTKPKIAEEAPTKNSQPKVKAHTSKNIREKPKLEKQRTKKITEEAPTKSSRPTVKAQNLRRAIQTKCTGPTKEQREKFKTKLHELPNSSKSIHKQKRHFEPKLFSHSSFNPFDLLEDMSRSSTKCSNETANESGCEGTTFDVRSSELEIENEE